MVRDPARVCGCAARRAGSRRLSRVDVAHRQAHTALPIHLENLDPHHVAFLQFVADALDTLLGYLRDVHQSVAPRENGHEGAEVHEPGDLTLVHSAYLDVRGYQFDTALRFASRGTLDGGDLHRAVVLDVD